MGERRERESESQKTNLGGKDTEIRTRPTCNRNKMVKLRLDTYEAKKMISQFHEHEWDEKKN